MTSQEFFDVIDTFANKDLFTKNGKYWVPTFEIL
jgi:hypothetical protein